MTSSIWSKSFKANVGAILNVIKTAKHGVGDKESLNEVERIVLKASLNKKANVSENAMFFELNDKTAIKAAWVLELVCELKLNLLF